MSHLSHSSADFFEAKYQRDGDPWNFAHSDYERRRYDAILAALQPARYGSGVEPGCSVGVLTEGLAPLCDHLLAIDFSPTAVRAAAERCRRFEHVEVACRGLEEVESFAGFDLVVLSEIGYYFSEARWGELSKRMVGEMRQGATLLAAHWTGESKDHAISGDRVHEVLFANAQLNLQQSERHAGFRLERWERS